MYPQCVINVNMPTHHFCTLFGIVLPCNNSFSTQGVYQSEMLNVWVLNGNTEPSTTSEGCFGALHSF